MNIRLYFTLLGLLCLISCTENKEKYCSEVEPLFLFENVKAELAFLKSADSDCTDSLSRNLAEDFAPLLDEMMAVSEELILQSGGVKENTFTLLNPCNAANAKNLTVDDGKYISKLVEKSLSTINAKYADTEAANEKLEALSRLYTYWYLGDNAYFNQDKVAELTTSEACAVNLLVIQKTLQLLREE